MDSKKTSKQLFKEACEKEKELARAMEKAMREKQENRSCCCEDIPYGEKCLCGRKFRR